MPVGDMDPSSPIVIMRPSARSNRVKQLEVRKSVEDDPARAAHVERVKRKWRMREWMREGVTSNGNGSGH